MARIGSLDKAHSSFNVDTRKEGVTGLSVHGQFGAVDTAQEEF